MLKSKISPEEITINSLVEKLFNEDLSGFLSDLDQVQIGSLDAKEDDSVDIGIVLSNQLPDEASKLSLDQRRDFLSKIKIDSENLNHYNVLIGLINPARDVEMMKYVLEAGFDPGSSDGSQDVLEIAVQQCQISSKSTKEGFFSNSRAGGNVEKDLELIKLMMRTGKIAGFFGKEGRREADRIDEIQETGKLPSDWGLAGANLVRVENGKIVRTYNGDERLISFDAENNIDVARAYVSHLYYNAREIKSEIDSQEVKIDSEEVYQEQPSSSTLSTICAALSNCFGRSGRG